MALALDIVDGTEISQRGGDYAATRVALVDGLTDQPQRRMYQALNYPGIPAYGQPHPMIPGIVVVNKRASMIDGSPNAAHVEINYDKRQLVVFPDRVSDTSRPLISVGGSVQVKTTNMDAKGKLITLRRYDPSTTEGQDPKNIQTGEVTFYQPASVVRYERREPNDPTAKSYYYTGKLNKTAVFGDGPRYWMCTRIEGHSTDGGDTYNVVYEFQFDRNQWEAMAVYTDPETGYPIGEDELVLGQSMKWVVLYDTVEFRNLRLTT